MDWIQAIERLGGWAVVAFIVFWGVRKMNARDDQMERVLKGWEVTISGYREALDTLKASVEVSRHALERIAVFEVEDRSFHRRLAKFLKMPNEGD